MREARRTAGRPIGARRGKGRAGFTLVEALLGVGLLGLSAVGVALSAEADARCQTAAAQAAELERGAEQAVLRIRAVCTAPGVKLLAPDPRASGEFSSSLAIVRSADASAT